MDIAQQRLVNQRLAGPPLATPAQVVDWLVAVQAQDYAGAKWGLGLRSPAATDADVDAAFNAGAILRTHVLRPTWHFVAPADIRWLLALTAPRVHAVNTGMYRKLDLDNALFARSHDALTRSLAGGNQLTREESGAALASAGIATDNGQRLAYLMMQAELDGLICSGARRGKQFTYALLAEQAPQARVLEREAALADLARRFFGSRGPASVADLAKWSGLTVADVRRGLEEVKSELASMVVDGQTLWFSASASPVNTQAPTAYLLSIYDEYVSSYKDRRAMVADEVAARLWEIGNGLSYIIVVDGQIVGTAKRTISQRAVVITTELLTKLTDAQHEAVTIATQRYGSFLGLPVALSP